MIKKTNLSLGLILSLLLLNFLVWLAVFETGRSAALEVIFFDVGQGDAIFVKTPWGHQLLIDGGPSKAILEKLSQEMPFYDRAIDLVVLTHPDKDHLFGLIEVLKNYQVDNVLVADSQKQTSGFEEWLEVLEIERQTGAQVRSALAGQRILANSLALEILNPYNLKEQEAGDINDASIVIRLIFGRNSFLFTGDLTRVGEKQLIGQGIDLDSDILKLGHHGSRFSSSEIFLRAVSPELAVISVGENSYGHPHQEVLDRLKQLGITCLRTDEQEDVKILGDGYQLKVVDGY